MSRRTRHRTSATTVAVLLLAGLLAACSGSDGDSSGSANPADASADASSETGCDGSVESPEPRFMVDDCGRVLLLRGVNVEGSSKGDEQAGDHLPKSGLDGQSALDTWGWNTVRFLVFWGAIEPEEGQYSEEYLNGVEKWLDWYAENDIHVVLDMHQDLYAWEIGFDGAPDWAVDTRGLEPGPVDESAPWYLRGTDPAVQAAYQSFWNPTEDQPDLQAAWLDALEHLAERFADHPAVIGYDVMNEPAFANGDLDATLAIQEEAAAGKFQNPNLTQFMQGGIESVRGVDDDAWVFVEPTSLINAFPYPGDLLFDELNDPREGAQRLVYAGHLYEPDVHDGLGYGEDSTYVEEWQGYRTTEAEQFDAALWFGEWGGPPDQEGMDRYIDDVLTMADEELAGWAWWSWDPGGWSPVEEDGTTPSANGEALLRVQPRAVAGTPTEVSWDAEELTFEMAWDERAEATGPTELAVPAALFADGIEVVLDGEAVPSPDWDDAASVLRLDADRSSADHQVCVAPADSDTCST